MITRLTDPGAVNRLVGRDFEGTDLSEVMAEPLHVVLADGESGAVFMWRGPGIYEVHVFFAARGRDAVTLGHRMLHVMRKDYGATMFWAFVPAASRHVRMFTRLMGWKSLGMKETRHGTNELFLGDCECRHPS